MQKCSIVFLCVLLTIILIEAKPWCSYFGCNDESQFMYEGNGGYIAADEGGSGEGEILDGGYIDRHSGYDRYNNRNRYDSRDRYGVGGGHTYGGYGDGGYDHGGYGHGGYDHGVYDHGGYSYGGYGDGGYGRDKYGSVGHGGGGHGGGGGLDVDSIGTYIHKCQNCVINNPKNGK